MSLKEVKHLGQTEGCRTKNQTQMLGLQKHVLSLNTKLPCLLDISVWGINISVDSILSSTVTFLIYFLTT